MSRSINLSAAGPFLRYLEQWYAALPAADLATIVGGRPERVAVFSIDMINGFCNEGPWRGRGCGRSFSRWWRSLRGPMPWGCGSLC